MDKVKITSRVLKTENINWRELAFIQQDNFKELSSEDMNKLKASLVTNNFIQPFYVWEDADGIRYCLDGKHRTKAQEELISEGVDVPYTLPATFIDCKDKKEAARLVLIFSSFYAKITQKGLFDFKELYDLDMIELKGMMNLPEFSMPRFEQKFDLFGINETNENDDLIEELPDDELIIVNKGDIFRLGRHRLACGSFKDLDIVSELMGGLKARIINTDPPYNLPADYIGNVEEKVHEDFIEGHGEMTDDEFVDFLAKVMRTSCDNSNDGSIHYIFMDFRHTWHMGEASKRIYGTPEPKQMCVWAKDMIAMGSFYRAQHELCFVYKSGNEKHVSHLDLSDRIRSNVWKYPSAISVANPDRHQIKNHPTPKPVQMIADAILDTTNDGDIVIDWFLGSGTALIACEKTKRRCFATELNIRYVQQIIKRYIKYCRNNDYEPEVEHLNGNLTLKDFENGSK